MKAWAVTGVAHATRALQMIRAMRDTREPYTGVLLRPGFDNASGLRPWLERLQWYAGGARIEVGATVRGESVWHEVADGIALPTRRDTPGAKKTLILIRDVDASRPRWTEVARCRMVDPMTSGKGEAKTMARLANADLLPIEAVRKTRSEAEIGGAQLLADIKERDGCQLFATGPTMDDLEVTRRVRDNALRVACNSIVRDPQLLQQLVPDILTFGDPAFHFGDSAYAQRFRADVLQAMRRHRNMRVVVPRDVGMLLRHELHSVWDRVILFPLAAPRRHGVFSLAQRGQLLRSGNVLTSAMLPLAACVKAGSIEMFGFDGREAGERGYWSYSKTVQYGDLYATVMLRHPGFFQGTDHERYYTKHCNIVKSQIDRLANNGRRRVVTRTPSHIPALRDRYEP